MPRKKKPRARSRERIDPELVDQLLAGADASEVLGPDGLLKQLIGSVVERALSAELTEHLGYEPSELRSAEQSNARNGYTPKTLITGHGKVDVQIPRDREGSFEPQLVKKHQRRLAGFDDKVLALYSRGMSVRDVRDHLEEVYGTEVSKDLITRVTDGIMDEVREWRSRRLDPVWPIVYLDAIFIKIRGGAGVTSKAVYVALGMSLQAEKEVLGLWIGDGPGEGAKYWMKVLGELQQRGVEDILVACCDGLVGLPEAIKAVFPNATTQTCVVHQIRSSTKAVAWADRKEVSADLKPIYTAISEDAALDALEAFDKKWGETYPSVSNSWRRNWESIVPFLAFPADMRRLIYTTNAIEGLNRQLRKVVKTRGHFPTDQAVVKVLYMAIKRATAKWNRQRPSLWQRAIQQFAIAFPGRVTL